MTPDGQPEVWLPITIAAKAVGRPERTLRTWARRLQVATCCRLGNTTTLVWWPHVHAQATREQRTYLAPR